jgi:hypothetical protein
MDNPGNTYGSDGNPRRFWAGLLIVKKLISRLFSLFSVTEQELIDAGVYLHRTRERN